MDVTSLYTNIPQEEGITTVCKAYEKFHNYNPPIPSHNLKEMLCLILKENSFQFIGKNYLQTHGTAMGTKMAVAFANIFMAEIETKLIKQSNTKPIKWKRYIDDIFSLWDSNIKEINLFIKQANFHPTGVKKGFIKGEALRLLRTNSSETAFNDSITNFKSRLIARDYPHKMIQTTLSEVNFAGRQSALQQKAKARKQILPLPFVTTYHPSVGNLKNILMLNWDLIQNQPLLNTIFKNPPILSYRRGKSLNLFRLVKAKL